MDQTLTQAEALRPSWSDPREPRFAQLRDFELTPDQVRREAIHLIPSMADYPREISQARRLDDLIARSIVNDQQVAIVVALAYGIELSPDQRALGRVDFAPVANALAVRPGSVR